MEIPITLTFVNEHLDTRAIDPDEELITDISIMVFDEKGDAEECLWLTDGQRECSISILKDKNYTICTCANFGYQVYADNIEELQELTYHMAYPDEYKEGIPMSGQMDINVSESCEITVRLTRMMAKISLCMDRSRLSEDIEMNVRSVRIGNCPKYAHVFSDNKVRDEDECFALGFHRDDLETSKLNYSIHGEKSEAISLYMLENMQGKLDRFISEDKDKIFNDNDSRRKTCSYIEMELEYLSSMFQSGEKNLIYRFYIGEDRNSLDIRRNTHYRFSVTPEDDGLSEDSWRVDKNGLSEVSPPYFNAYPSGYINGDIGDKIHIWCEFSPHNAPFDVGLAYMEEDKAEGIYDYIIDEDGHGATLTLTGPGTGLIYMEAGEPVNESALFIIEVNLP